MPERDPIFLGIVVGYLNPGLGKSLKPLGDGFINLVKMIIAPVIFCTVVHGIASMSDVKKLGRIAIKALVYFEVVSTLALVIGLVVINALHPGAGFNIDVKALQADHLQQSQALAQKAHSRWEKEVTKEELNVNLLKSKSVADFVPEDIEAEAQAGGKSAPLPQSHSL